jgi:hypothetical protein
LIVYRLGKWLTLVQERKTRVDAGGQPDRPEGIRVSDRNKGPAV